MPKIPTSGRQNFQSLGRTPQATAQAPLVGAGIERELQTVANTATQIGDFQAKRAARSKALVEAEVEKTKKVTDRVAIAAARDQLRIDASNNQREFKSLGLGEATQRLGEFRKRFATKMDSLSSALPSETARASFLEKAFLDHTGYETGILGEHRSKEINNQKAALRKERDNSIQSAIDLKMQDVDGQHSFFAAHREHNRSIFSSDKDFGPEVLGGVEAEKFSEDFNTDLLSGVIEAHLLDSENNGLELERAEKLIKDVAADTSINIDRKELRRLKDTVENYSRDYRTQAAGSIMAGRVMDGEAEDKILREIGELPSKDQEKTKKAYENKLRVYRLDKNHQDRMLGNNILFQAENNPRNYVIIKNKQWEKLDSNVRDELEDHIDNLKSGKDASDYDDYVDTFYGMIGDKYQEAIQDNQLLKGRTSYTNNQWVMLNQFQGDIIDSQGQNPTYLKSTKQVVSLIGAALSQEGLSDSSIRYVTPAIYNDYFIDNRKIEDIPQIIEQYKNSAVSGLDVSKPIAFSFIFPGLGGIGSDGIGIKAQQIVKAKEELRKVFKRNKLRREDPTPSEITKYLKNTGVIK